MVGNHESYEAFAEYEDIANAYLAGENSIINDACVWLAERFKDGDTIQSYAVDNFIKDFKRAMVGK